MRGKEGRISQTTHLSRTSPKRRSKKLARGLQGEHHALAGQMHHTRRPMKTKEVRLVTDDTPPTNNGVPEQTPARQDVDVLLDVSELEVDKIKLTVRGLRAHV